MSDIYNFNNLTEENQKFFEDLGIEKTNEKVKLFSEHFVILMNKIIDGIVNEIEKLKAETKGKHK